MRALIALILSLSLCLVPRTADACQYVRWSIFQIFTGAEIVAVVKAGKRANDATQELAMIKVIKSAGVVPAVVRVKPFEDCGVAFDEGRIYLVHIDDKHRIAGYGAGIIQAPSAALIEAVELWKNTPTLDKRTDLLRRFAKSTDPRVAEEAKIMLEIMPKKPRRSR